MKLLLGIQKKAGCCLVQVNTDNGGSMIMPLDSLGVGGIASIDKIDFVCGFENELIAVANNDVDPYSRIIFVTSRKSFVTEAKFITSVIPIMKNKMYVVSSGTDSIRSITYNSETKKLENDTLHYALTNSKTDYNYISGLVIHNSRWYASIYGPNWRNDSSNGCIVELSNQRIVRSNCKFPNGIIFDSRGKLCFCDSGNKKVILGNYNVKVDGNPNCLIDDIQNKGYWVAINNHKFHIDFISYDGIIGKQIYLDKDVSKCYSIVNIENMGKIV